MIPYSEVLAPTPNSNPDKDNIKNKKDINIGLALPDVSASGYLPRVQTNYNGQEIIIFDDDDSNTIGDVYYTPLYKEKISYNQWKVKINKSFEELESK